MGYNDGYVIAAQVLSILATLIGWIRWVAFIISVAALVLFQVLWCCRQKKVGMVATQMVCFLAATANIGAGIWVLLRWRYSKWCEPFFFDADDNRYVNGHYDDCPEHAWAIISFLDAILWLAAGSCLFAFVKTGRHARWEANLTGGHTTISTTLEPGTAIPVGKVVNTA